MCISWFTSDADEGIGGYPLLHRLPDRRLIRSNQQLCEPVCVCVCVCVCLCGCVWLCVCVCVCVCAANICTYSCNQMPQSSSNLRRASGSHYHMLCSHTTHYCPAQHTHTHTHTLTIHTHTHPPHTHTHHTHTHAPHTHTHAPHKHTHHTLKRAHTHTHKTISILRVEGLN